MLRRCLRIGEMLAERMRLVIFRERLQLQYLISTSILHHIIFIIFLIYNTNFIYLHNLERLAWLGKIWVTVAWVLLSLWLGTAEGGVIWASSPCPKKSNEIAWVKSSGDWCINRTNSSSVLYISRFWPLHPLKSITHTWTLAHHRKRVRRTLRQHVACATWWKASGWSLAPRINFQDMPKHPKVSKGWRVILQGYTTGYDLKSFSRFHVFDVFRSQREI